MTSNLQHSIKFAVPVALCLASLLLIACSSGTDVGNPQVTAMPVSGEMTGFSSDSELEAYLKDQYVKRIFSDYHYGLENDVPDITDANTGGGATGGGSGNGGSDSGGDAYVSEGYTGTNLQEEGVDEADVVKTDGTYLYVAGADYVGSANTITVVRAADPMAVISTLQVDGTVDSMYLYGHLLVVLYIPIDYEGDLWVDSYLTEAGYIGIPYWIPIRSRTGVAVFDVSDPAAPLELKTIEADGYLVSSRRVENKLHVVQQYLPDLPAPEELEDTIGDMSLEELIPFYQDITGGRDGERSRLVASEDFYHPMIDGGGSIVTIMTFDLDDPGKPFTSIGTVVDASVVYGSTEALYCTATYWNYSDTVSWSYSDTIPREPVQQTVVYKFDITGYEVAGRGFTSVNGRILNQFSLGEYQDVLRIATTTGRSGTSNATSENHVYCVASQDNGLEIIGRLEGLAPGEEIYAARFIGPRGYLVTFVKVDPLFTLDLSDPTAPKAVGELKVPGYSEYIHPMGDNHLITIGKEDDSTLYQSVQLSIFDISDFADPKLLHTETIGDRCTDSEALDNHKAFTFWEENGLLAIPIRLYEYDSTTLSSYCGTFKHMGLYVYRISIEDGFERIGTIMTSTNNEWLRGIFMGDDVYAVKSDAVKKAEIDDIEGTEQSIQLYDGPLIVGNYRTGGKAVNVYVSGSYAYTTDSTSGLNVIDVSDPENPIVIGVCNAPEGAYNLSVSGDYAYVLDGYSRLRVIDISNPENPHIVGHYGTGTLVYYNDVYAYGGYAYLKDDNGHIIVLDVSDPENPNAIAKCIINYSWHNFNSGIHVSGSYAYVADENFQVIDVSDPGHPFRVFSSDSIYHPSNVYVSNNYAYVVINGSINLYVFDISDPVHPIEVSQWTRPAWADLTSFRDDEDDAVFVSNNYAYVGAGTRIFVIDISDPQHPSTVGFCNLPDRVNSIFVSGEYAYAADDDFGLQVLKLSE